MGPWRNHVPLVHSSAGSSAAQLFGARQRRTQAAASQVGA